MSVVTALADLFADETEAHSVQHKNWGPDSSVTSVACHKEDRTGTESLPTTTRSPNSSTCLFLPLSSSSPPTDLPASSLPSGRKCLMYNELPISIKVRLIREYETQNCSQRSLARKYTVSRGTVNQIIKQKNRYLTEFAKIQSMAEASSGGLRANTNCMTLKRVRKTSITNVNHVLEQFVATSRMNKWTLSGPKLKQKAREVAQEMGLSDFKASNGWLDHFKKRCSLEFNSSKAPADPQSGRRSNQENRDFDQNMQDISDNNNNTLLPDPLNSQSSPGDHMDVCNFNLMALDEDCDQEKQQTQHLTSSSTTSSPHSELNFTADSTVPLDLQFSTGISVSDPVSSETSGHLHVNDFPGNHTSLVSDTSDNNCPHHQSAWVLHPFGPNDSTTPTAPSPDSCQRPQHGMTHGDQNGHHLAHMPHQNHSHHHHPQQQQQQAVQQQQAQQHHSHHSDRNLAEETQLPEDPLDSLPHTLSLPSDQLIHVELAGHMGSHSALTAVPTNASPQQLTPVSPSSSSPCPQSKHSTVGPVNQDVKHCRFLLTVNTSSSCTDASTARSSPSSKCHHSDSEIEVPAIADVRSAIDTLERFALTKMPPLLSSILSIRQEVGNFVIQQQVHQDQFNHHPQHQQQQQNSQNHLLNQ